MTDKPAPETPESENASVETEAAGKPAPAKRGGLAVGAAVGIGSAAVVAALLYVRHRKKGA